MPLRKLEEPGKKQTTVHAPPLDINMNILIIIIGVVIILFIIIWWLSSGYHYELFTPQIPTIE